MKNFIIIIFSLFFLTTIKASEVTIIDLHNKPIDQAILDVLNADTESTDELAEEIYLEDINTELFSNNEVLLELEALILLNDNSQIEEIVTLPDFWEKTEKEDLIFLLKNIGSIKSINLRNELLEILNINSKPPQNLNKSEFENLIVTNLIKFGNRKKAYEIIQSLDNNDNHEYINYYSNFELNYLFATYNLSEACEFRDEIKANNLIPENNFLLKVDIFCLFLKEKLDEANLLNTLLEESETIKDEYFQKIYNNLIYSKNDDIEFSNIRFDQNSIFLYSAMHRVGNIPLSFKFLDIDPSNLSMPIILSSSTDISLRLMAAHEAYNKELLSTESLSALYQTVDFSYEELSNPSIFVKELNGTVEIGMAYYYQLANIQLLPITRLEAVLEFWKFAEKNHLKLISYDLSRKILDSIEPSNELSEYGPEIAKAYIYNNDIKSAEKWLLFTENFNTGENNLNRLQSTKLLYHLFNAHNIKTFNEALSESFQNIELGFFTDNQEDATRKEILFTIYSVLNEKNKNPFIVNKNLIDPRLMPSGYIINKIRENIKKENHAELLITIIVSLNEKKWIEVHPEHLRLILVGLKEYKNQQILINIILEILQESKII